MKKLRLFLYIFTIAFAFISLVSCKPKEYKVSFLYEDGTVIEELTFKKSKSIKIEAPEKEGHEFLGWFLNGEEIELPYVFEKNATVYAKYEPKTYTYQFIVEGKVIKEGSGLYGSEITYPENPTKESTSEFTYVFAGWDNSAKTLTKNEVFNGSFTSTTKEYTYTFETEDGEVIISVTAPYGSTIQYPKNPTKESTEEFDFEFVGWDNDDKTLTKDVVFKPIFNGVKKEYTYKFFNYDGTLLKEGKGVQGTLPQAPEDPTRPSANGKKYVFAGWDKEIVALTENVTYTATYEEVEVSIEGLKLSILGDSISTFYAEGSSMNSYYSGENQFYYPLFSSTIKTVDKTWWAQLLANTNMELGINNSWSGSCAFGTGASAGQTDGRIFTLNENGNPDIVIVYLGTNDLVNAFTVEEYSSALVQIITKVKALGVENIFLTTLGYTDYTGYNYTEAGRVAYNAEIREVADEYGCGVVPLDEYIVEDNYSIYLGDYLHYNAKGATLLSKIYEKTIKEYFGIEFNEDIEVEHKEQLPDGILGKITATSNSSAGFWTEYATNVYLAKSDSFLSPQYSFRYEITKNETNGKYYVTGIHVSGDSVVYNSDYVIVISETHENRVALVESLSKVEIGSIVEFDVSLSFPVEVVFKAGDGNLPGEETPEPDPEPEPDPNPGEKEGLEGLKVSILGDSISTFYAEGSSMNSLYGGENQFFYPRYSSTIKTVEKTWWAQLINNNKMVLGVNNSWSGSTAAGSGASAGQSDGRINTINENGTPDIVIIYLGTNDAVNGFTVKEFAEHPRLSYTRNTVQGCDITIQETRVSERIGQRTLRAVQRLRHYQSGRN